MFMWRLMAGVIPTRELLSDKIGSQERSCAICGKEVESAFHSFKECQGIRVLAFANKWGCRLDKWTASSMEEIIQMCIDSNCRPSIQGMED